MHVACQSGVGFLPGVRWITPPGRARTYSGQEGRRQAVAKPPAIAFTWLINWRELV